MKTGRKTKSLRKRKIEKKGACATTEKQNWFIEDNIENNSLWAFDYCFCCGCCAQKNCGRNAKSKSYRSMIWTVTHHTVADLTALCSNYFEQ